MVVESRRAGALPVVRRGLLLAGLAVAGWAVTRTILLLSGNEDVVSDDDVHGYLAIFSLVAAPVLALAFGTLLADTVTLWRGRRTRHVAPGVTLVLSAPLASPLAIVAAVVGVAIVVTALLDRPGSGGGH
jgi:hypothetical protein